MANTFRDLTAWQKAFSLCLDVYRATQCFPKVEVYGLASQMQRAAVSIPSNIAEGFGRRTTPDFLRSLYIAYGLTCELQTQIMLATELGYLKSDASAGLLQSAGDVERLTKAFIRSLGRWRRSAFRRTRAREHFFLLRGST